ncbi:hypothetical protein ABEB36_000631 [Hypothenemus hampei]|uniref:Odorant receptor n=1 Tax=Hypothenemus hampei TaxID=57062 RepID=A0ABD1FDU1_HYPHA
MEQELRKIMNSITLKVESFVLFLGANTLLSIIMNLYDQLFYEDRFLLQSFFSQDSILYQMARIIVCCFFVLATIPSVFSPIQLIYLVFTSQLLLLQLLDKIKKFDKKISNENVDDVCILENLKVFGQHHLDIRSFHYDAFEATHLYSTFYSITGLVLGISSLIAMFSYNAPKGPALLTFFGYISFLYCISALIQEYENTQEYLSDALYDLKWYWWDAKCQKFHLILMGQVSKEFKISILFLLHADFEIFKKFIRLTYTAANCLVTFRRKNN